MSRSSNIKIEFFDDRCEIISPGGFFDGLTLEEALNGLQSFRNEKLVQLLFKLNYIENYASGLTRIFSEYKKLNLNPEIYTTVNMFKITLPNRNYDALFLNPQKHLNDNKSIRYDRFEVNDELNSRDANIFKIIKLYPGKRVPQLLELLQPLDPTITSNILHKRLDALCKIIEYRGAKKTGGYFIKNLNP